MVIKAVYYFVDFILGVEISSKKRGSFGSSSVWEEANDLTWARKSLLGGPGVGGDYRG